ncbi:hypothetical protein FB45DRAFT_903264 [Roridomyces roridus]|uniref:Uncharacterized protein n=1 Tax=Roridomyces roridus TaxID=1738132 RepID=A0AAD7C400_9AGAR|nr:hypothetical protein FB45DRAFT_903264 [Roridomyces roridus]
MFDDIHSNTAAEQASQTLVEEGTLRFPSFSSADAVTLGLSIRKRFRATSRHVKGGKGLVISIQTIAGHPLFSCTVGDLGHFSGIGDVSLDSWSAIEGMINVVKRTGHSSYYVEKGMAAMGKTAKQMGFQGELRINGGAFPIWLENAPCCPIAVVACYSGSSQDDHHLVATTVRDYLKKMLRPGSPSPTAPSMMPPAAGNGEQPWPPAERRQDSNSSPDPNIPSEEF